MSRTWKEKIGKRLMKHVAESTPSSTLWQVKRNIQWQHESNTPCFDCQKIALKLGIKPTTT